MRREKCQKKGAPKNRGQEVMHDCNLSVTKNNCTDSGASQDQQQQTTTSVSWGGQEAAAETEKVQQ